MLDVIGFEILAQPGALDLVISLSNRYLFMVFQWFGSSLLTPARYRARVRAVLSSPLQGHLAFGPGATRPETAPSVHG